MQRAQTQERVRAIKDIEDDARAYFEKQDGEKLAKEEGAVMSAVRSFARGSDRLMQGLLNSPAFIYDIAAVPQNIIAEQFDIPSLEVSSTEVFGENEAAKQLSERIERSQAVTQSKYDKGITEYISKGDYGNAVGMLFSQISESAPITLSLMAGNAAGLSTAGSTIGGGIVFGSDKKKELDKEAPWMSEAQKTQIAFANGLLEGFFEQYGITKLGSIAKDVLERSGKATAEKAAEKYFKDTYGKVLLKYLGVTGEEAVSEMATQFSQNALDKYTGVKPDLDLMDGLIDAGLVGLASGSIYSAIPSGIELARTREAKKKNAKIQQEKQDLNAAAQQAEGNPVVQKAYAEKMKELNLQEAETLAEENAAYRNLSPENKDMVDALSVEVNDLETQLQDESLPDVAKEAIKDRIAQIDAEIDSIVFPAPEAKTVETVDSVEDEMSFYEQQAESPEPKTPIKIKSIAEIVAEQKAKKDGMDLLESAKQRFKEQKEKGEILLLRKEEESKEAIKEQRKKRDAEVEEIAKIRPDLTDDDLLLADIPSVVDRTIDRMDLGIPSDPIQIEEAISSLDKKFQELEAYKNNSKRTHTEAQINEVIDLLNEAKIELQLYQEQILDYEKSTESTAKRRAETQTAQDAKIAESKGKTEKRLTTSEPTPKTEALTAPENVSLTNEGNNIQQTELQAQTPTENPELANVEAGSVGVGGEPYLVDYVFIEKINPNGENTALTERQEGSIDKAVQMAIDAGQAAEQIAGTLNALGYAFRNPLGMQAAQQTLINYIKNRINGTDTRNINEFAKNTKAVETILTPQTNETQIETQAEAASTEAAVPQAERGGASQEEAVNQVPADTAVEVEEGVLSPRAEALLQNSLAEYQEATPERQSEMIAQVQEQLSLNEKGEQAIGMGLDADAVAAGKEFLRQVEPQTPPQDATQERNVEQSNLTEREGITQQQQGQEADRGNQDGNVQEGEAEASGSDSVAEGRAEQKIAQTAKSIADVIRQGKINKPGYLQASAGALVWDGAIEVIATAVEKGGDLAQAIADGFEHIRKSDYYKGLTEKDRRRFIKDFTRSVNQLRRDYELPLDPILSIGEMDVSSLKTRLIKGTKLPKYVKDGIEEKGIAYEVENQDLARDYANALIDILGLDAAVDLALKGKVKGGTKTFILGANVDAFANTPNTPEFLEAVEIFDEALRTSGQEISAAYRVYLNSPDGLYHYERKKVRKDIDAEITTGEKGKNIEATKKKAKRTRKEKAKDVAKEVVDGLSGKNDPTVTEKKVNPDAAKKKAALDKLAKAKNKLAEAKKKADALRKGMGIISNPQEQGYRDRDVINALIEIGVANIELGYLNAKAWLRKMKEDIKGLVDVSDKELLDILETAKDNDGKSLAEKMEEAKWEAGKEKLAERIAAQMEAPEANDFDPVKTVVDNLFSKVAEQQKVEKKKPLTNIEKAKVTIENYQKARELWAKAKAEVVDLIDKMEISDELKSAYIFDLDIFLERTMGLGISENSATTIVKDQIKALTNDKSLRDSIEKILAQSVDGRAKTKEEFINQVSKELELNTSLSPAQSEYIAKQFANRYEAVVSEEMKKFLNQQFPDRVKENQKEKEKQNAAIVREIIWGALNDSEFASKFYEKYGFGYVNDPAFNQELRRLAENIYKAPQGFLKQQAMDELASYVRVSRDGIRYWSLPMNLMVNNLLLGPETFLKAIDSNTIQTIAATGQMIASDPKNTKFYLEKMFKEQGEGVINLQLRKIGFWMGIKGVQSYRDSDVAGLELGKELEKYGKNKFSRGFGKYIQMSNKGLSAVDLIYSKSGEFAKFAQLVLRNIQIENNKLPKDQRASKEEMQALTNEILGNTSDRVQAAYTQALKEIKETFGVDEVVMGKKNPSKEEVALKARIIEILEQGRAERLNDVKQKVDWLDAFTEKELEIFTKYSKMYGEKISLMGTPRGSAGFISLALQGLGRNAPILKYIQVAPIFVNAPMNFGNLVIDSTPLGILRAGIFAAKGRRGAVIGREQALRQGEITRTESEMIYAMERNALIARVISLNTMTFVGLAAMGFNFFRSPDDEEEEFTKEKFKQMPYYVTAGISPNREKVVEIEKAFGIEPYTVYSYGRKVLSYRNSAMIAPLAMQGAMMDAQNFRTDDIESNLDLFAAASIATIAFISEQSAVKGASEALGALAGIGKYEKDVKLPDRLIEAAKRNLASTTKAMIMPRLIPALYKDFQGIMEMDKTRATTFRDFLVEDVPFLEDMIVTKQVDHFGEPIKEEFFMPSPFGGLSLIGWDKGFFKGPFSEITQTNPYYKLAFEAGYTPKAYRDDKLTKEMTAKEFETFQPLSKAEIAAKKETDVTGIYIVELDLTPEQVAEINRIRGKYVRDYLDDNMTKFKKYSKSERKEIFERLFEVGTKYAKTKVTGVDYVGSGNFRIEKLEIDLPSMK